MHGHIELLVENTVLETPKKKYGSIYFIGSEWDDNQYLIELMRGNGNGKKKK